MLTTKERIWLKNRERRLTVEHRYYSCKYCGWFNKRRHECEAMEDWPSFCDAVHESFDDEYMYDLGSVYKDAAEFEARVARKLAIPIVSDGRPCPWGESNLCICEGEGVWLGCEGSRLKWARLAVEKEMDG